MKSKLTILSQYVPEGVLPNITEQCIADAMDEYAKQQADAVIKDLEEINGVIGTPHLNHAINLIKKHFNIV